MALQRGPGFLLSCLNATTLSSTRPCLHILRRFSQTQLWSTPEKQHNPLPFQSYPLPSRPTPSLRNESIPEIPIANPVPLVHETRPPDQPQITTQPERISEEETSKPKPTPAKRKLRPRKAALKLTPTAVKQLRRLLDAPEPKLIKVGVRNRGCSGLAYHLEYVDKPAAFDEEVEQDGVKVIIDSKALFSIIGSEMDWVEDKLNERFIFHNPNIKEECGCGESFMV